MWTFFGTVYIAPLVGFLTDIPTGIPKQKPAYDTWLVQSKSSEQLGHSHVRYWSLMSLNITQMISDKYFHHSIFVTAVQSSTGV